ncbi:MAG: PAS domain S-box protein, partial [Betaproteobacteria bacterium]|nr:PAS domain S-box protein [Betaproteobacteria bacterium]
MKISTRLYLALALTAIMIAAIGAIHAWFEARQAQEDHTATVQALIAKIAALSSLAHEYGANAHPRIERQWHVQVSTIRDLISKLHDFETVRSLDISLQNADRAFSQLRQNNAERQGTRTRSAGAKETARLNVIESAIKSLMRLEVEKLLSGADLIAAESRQKADALRRQAATVTTAIVILFLALVVAITLPAIRKATRSISTLADGVSAFGEGNLAHRIAVEGGGEIARLAVQFNAMAEAIDCSIQREREHVAALEREIEVRRNAEASLRNSEQQQGAFFELAAVGLAQADPRNGRLLRVNDRYCEIYGYPRDELLQMTSVQATHPEDRERNVSLLQRLHNGEVDTIDMEKRVVRKNGSIIWVHVNATVARDASGSPSRALAVVLDITARKQVEQELRLSRQRLALHVEQTPLAVIEFDLEGCVRQWNPAAVRTFGFSREQAIGQHWKFMV